MCLRISAISNACAISPVLAEAEADVRVLVYAAPITRTVRSMAIGPSIALRHTLSLLAMGWLLCAFWRELFPISPILLLTAARGAFINRDDFRRE